MAEQTTDSRLESAVAVIRWHQTEPVAPPVKVLDIALDLGMKVYFRIDLPADISGKIIRDERLGGASGFAIIVNKTHHHRRQRFTIAHEIAHYVLHRDLIASGGSIVDNEMYRSSLSDSLERQANRLGAEILMPAHLIRALHSKGVRNPLILAEKFDVSTQAMEIRLSELHLDQYSLQF